MDTLSFRLGDKEFLITNLAIFIPEYSRRAYSEISEKEKNRSKSPKTRYLRKFVLHPIKDNEEDIYVPRIEVYEKVNSNLEKIYYEAVITVQSLPKLIFNNNFEEIKVSDKEKIILLLVQRLKSIGVFTKSDYVKQAPVSVVHFCKNIILPADIPIRNILSDLSHTDMGKAYDTTEDVRRQRNKNNGSVVHLYCGTREWCFYDKIDDLLQPKGKRIDKYKTNYEKELIINYDSKNLEVFRFEYRLNKHQTIKSEINNFLERPYSEGVVISDLFTDKLWKAILNSAWKRVLQRPENQLALFSYDNSLDLLLCILNKSKSENLNAHSQNKALWVYGLIRAIKDHGAKTIKYELNKIWKNKDNRLIDKLIEANKFISGMPVPQGIFYVTEQLEKFEDTTLKLLEERINLS
jgi:hypothetical protein